MELADFQLARSACKVSMSLSISSSIRSGCESKQCADVRPYAVLKFKMQSVRGTATHDDSFFLAHGSTSCIQAQQWHRPY